MYKLVNYHSPFPLPMHEAIKNINNYNQLYKNYNSLIQNIYWKSASGLSSYTTSQVGIICDLAPRNAWPMCIWEISILMSNASNTQFSVVSTDGAVLIGRIGNSINQLSDGEEIARYTLSPNTDYVWRTLYLAIDNNAHYNMRLRKDSSNSVTFYQIVVKRYKNDGTV